MIMTAYDSLVDEIKKTTEQVIIKPWDVEELKSVIDRSVSTFKAEDRETGSAARIRKTVLYVENDGFVIEVVNKMLDRLGYDAIVAVRCSEAIRFMQSRPDMFDLVITDLGMPDVDGLELSRNLHVIRSDIPIILSTGHSDMVLDSGMEAVGIKAVLPKPFGMDEIARIIKKVMEE